MENSLTKLTRPTCGSCPHHLLCRNIEASGRNKGRMIPGERYCMACKRPRRFRRSDPKLYVPHWCPRRKSPCEVRIYCFKSMADFFLHDQLSCELGNPIRPEGRRYAVEYRLRTDLSPQEYWKRCNRESDTELLGTVVHRYHVVEIDDGLIPAYFYKAGDHYEIVRDFDAGAAQNDCEEDAID